MSRRSHGLGAAVCALGLGAAACAFTSKGEPLTPRYFSVSSVVARAEPPHHERSSGLRLRLGQVEAAAYLEERIAYRSSAAELGYYDDRRWTEPPEAYLRRELERELFEARGVRRVVSGPAPALDVELIGFEELRYGGERAHVALRFILYDERQAWLESSLEVVRPLVDDPEPAARALAISDALRAAVSELAARAVAELAARGQQDTEPASATPAQPE